MLADGTIRELLLLDGVVAARIACPEGAIPGAGQYLLAHAEGSDAALATVLFATRGERDGFVTGAPIPADWRPGTQLHLRGPLGHGFHMPAGARRVVLAAMHCSPRTLLSVLEQAFRQRAAVALVSRMIPDELPSQVEVYPPEALQELCRWADYAAFDVERERLGELRNSFRAEQALMKAEGQVLVRVPMPCGALAECGVCTVEVGRERLLACDDGPVFDFRQLMGWASRA